MTLENIKKSLYLAMQIITEKCAQPYHNLVVILGELRLHYRDKIPTNINV